MPKREAKPRFPESYRVPHNALMMMVMKRLLLALCLAAAVLTAMAVAGAGVGEATIDANGNVVTADGGVDPSIPPNEQLSITITNKSPYRIDLYYDDGDYGQFMSIIEKNDDTSLKSYIGHSFFVTRHGVKEGLFADPGTDHEKRLTFKVGLRDQIFVVPENSAPSANPCQDRFGICKTQAKTGGCGRSPGWMIVHCCESCDPHLNSSVLIDPKKRCSKEHLKTPENVWKPGDLNKLFAGWATDDSLKETYGLEVISSPEPQKYGATWENATDGSPWVVVFDNFLTDDEVRDLIRGGEIEGYERSTDQGATNELGEMEKVVSTTRTSANAWCTTKCERLAGVKSATKKIEAITG
ncbi:hypothetical protein ACHAW5_001441 [Stephanodiscus triporus]|uniref:Uncharacterized protein n=1 Tax=Stephanodiscus triporus TaxID=2934178 RepID=A0ABD3MW13_9STRA